MSRLPSKTRFALLTLLLLLCSWLTASAVPTVRVMPDTMPPPTEFKHQKGYKVWLKMDWAFGKRISGTLYRLDDTAVWVIIETPAVLRGDTSLIPVRGIAKISVRKRGRVEKGLLVGIGIGCAIGVPMIVDGKRPADCSGFDCFGAELGEALQVGLGASLIFYGLVIGLIVGTAKKRRTLNGDLSRYRAWRAKFLK